MMNFTGKPYAGKPHVRIDEGEGSYKFDSSCSLLYRKILVSLRLMLFFEKRKTRYEFPLRNNSTLKKDLTGKFYGINFNRQKIIGSYIVDFYVPSLSLVIEIDGWSHRYKEEYDKERDNYLKAIGLNIFKIPDIEIKRNLSWVMDCLKDFIISEYGKTS